MTRLELVPDASADASSGAGADADGGRRRDVEVRLGLEYLPVASAVATSLAIDLDFDLEAIEGVRIATDEACADLAARDDTSGLVLVVEFEAGRAKLRMAVQLQAADGRRLLTDIHAERTWFPSAGLPD